MQNLKLCLQRCNSLVNLALCMWMGGTNAAQSLFYRVVWSFLTIILYLFIHPFHFCCIVLKVRLKWSYSNCHFSSCIATAQRVDVRGSLDWWTEVVEGTVCSIYMKITDSLVQCIQGWWKTEFSQWSNLGFRKNNIGCVPTVEHWTRSLLLLGTLESFQIISNHHKMCKLGKDILVIPSSKRKLRGYRAFCISAPKFCLYCPFLKPAGKPICTHWPSTQLRFDFTHLLLCWC